MRVTNKEERVKIAIKAEQIAKKWTLKMHNEELERVERQRAYALSHKPLGNCFFCGRDIHEKTAAEDARLLKKFTKVETSMVCCGCFRSLKWFDKHLKVGGV